MHDAARRLRPLLHPAAAWRTSRRHAGQVRRHLGRGRRRLDSPVKAERANYYDVGISQKLAPGLQVGVDGYYKIAQNQLDDGLFGQTLILSAFNYARGEVHGVEFTGSYTKGGFSTYANLANSVAKGRKLGFGAVPFRAGGIRPTSTIIGFTSITTRR